MTNPQKQQRTFSFALIIIILSLILLGLIVFSLCTGKYEISAWESIKMLIQGVGGGSGRPPMEYHIVVGLRLPRVLGAAMVGAALAVSGAVYQGIFQNPLVSPDFLGVSSGASIGAAIGILLSLPSALISGLAFTLAILTVLITASIPRLIGNHSNLALVLSGIIVGSLMSSILGFLKYVADPDSELASITYWMMGDFSYVETSNLIFLLIVMLPCFALLLLISWWIDLMSLGTDEARALGANTWVIKSIVIISATLLTASAVCVAGNIGWVGLVIPNLARLLVGPRHSRLIPVSILMGSIFMLLADTLTRNIGVSEMPVSIITGIIGAPFFFWLLARKRGEFK